MKTVETLNEGLKREYRVTITAKDIDARVDDEVKSMAPTVRMPGFRPGKVPPNLIRKMHGAGAVGRRAEQGDRRRGSRPDDQGKAAPRVAARGHAGRWL